MVSNVVVKINLFQSMSAHHYSTRQYLRRYYNTGTSYTHVVFHREEYVVLFVIVSEKLRCRLCARCRQILGMDQAGGFDRVNHKGIGSQHLCISQMDVFL